MTSWGLPIEFMPTVRPHGDAAANFRDAEDGRILGRRRKGQRNVWTTPGWRAGMRFAMSGGDGPRVDQVDVNTFTSAAGTIDGGQIHRGRTLETAVVRLRQFFRHRCCAAGR